MREGFESLWDDLLDRIVPELGMFAPFDIGAKSTALWDALRDEWEEGDPDAEALIDSLGRDGCYKRLTKAKERAAKSVILRKRENGNSEKHSNQSYRARPRMGSDGIEYSQQALWWDFTYEDVVVLYDRITRSWETATEKRATFRRVVDAYSTHRNALNAAEACRLAGIDPKAIEISDDDIRRAMGS